MFDRYTKGPRRTLFLACHEAFRLGSPPIEPEHLLVGLLRSSNQRAGELLATRHACGLAAAGNRDPKRPIAVEAAPLAAFLAPASTPHDVPFSRRPAPGYDTQPPRRFDFAPLWHLSVVFVHAMPPRLLPPLRRQGRGHPVGHRQAPTDRRLRLVPRPVGQAPVVAGGRRGVPPPPGTPSIGPCAWPSTGASRTATSPTLRPSAWTSSRAVAGNAT